MKKSTRLFDRWHIKTGHSSVTTPLTRPADTLAEPSTR